MKLPEIVCVRVVVLGWILAVCASCRPEMQEPSFPEDSPMQQAVALEVDIRTVEASRVLERKMTGSFQQHRAVLDQIPGVIERTGAQPIGDPLGIYPEDPDVVGMERVRWSIAIPIAEAPGSADVDGWELRELPATTALVASTTVAESHAVGLALKIWTLNEGYVRVQPTRMRFRSPIRHQPDRDSVDIVFPVVKRSELAR